MDVRLWIYCSMSAFSVIHGRQCCCCCYGSANNNTMDIIAHALLCSSVYMESICENIMYLCNYIMHRKFSQEQYWGFFFVFHLFFLFSVLKEGKASFCLWFYSIILTLVISSDFWLFLPSNKHAHRVNELYMNLKPFKVMIPIFTLSFVSSNSVPILRYFILPPIVSIWLFKEI